MFKPIIVLFVFCLTIFSETLSVNLKSYDLKEIIIYEQVKAENVIKLNGYGNINVHYSDFILPKITMGTYNGFAMSLIFDSSMVLSHSEDSEGWLVPEIPGNIINTSKMSNPDNSTVGTYDLGEIEAVVEDSLICLPVFEDWDWSEDGITNSSSGHEIFKNVGEVFYLETKGGNNLKFEIVYNSQYDIRLKIATDSLKNGRFPIDDTPITKSNSSGQFGETMCLKFQKGRFIIPQDINNGRVDVMALNGRIIKAVDIIENVGIVGVLPKGMYVYRLYSGNDFIGKDKLIIN